MVVSFSIGDKSKKVINTLKKTADNVDFHSYPSLQALAKEAKLRHLDFKRIIFSTTILKDARKDLTELNDFIKEYSTSTEVIMILMDSDSGSDKIFNSIFDSPMYTPVILPKATSKNLLELVLSDVMELKAKYYVLDRGKLDVEEPENLPEPENVQETNNSFSTQSGLPKDTSTSGEAVPESYSGFSSGPAPVFVGFGGTSTSLNSSEVEEGEIDSRNISDGSGSVGANNLSSNDSENFISEEADLSIGSFGSKHSDTGFLDEEGDEELKEFARSQKLEEGNTRLENGNSTSIGENRTLENRNDTVRTLPNIDLVTALRGNGSTQAIIDESVKIVNQDGARVLIIDLDNEENGILAYIDADKFYRESAYEGIRKQRVYTEDGVSIVSNGFGIKVTTRELKNFLSSRIPTEYDMIYIDCPITSLSIIDKELLDLINILVISNTDRSQLIATSLALTNRKYLSLDVERKLMSTCMVELDGSYSQEDVEFVKHTCLFANGNWLDRVDL